MNRLELSELQIKVLDKMHRGKCVGYKDQRDLGLYNPCRWWYIISYSIDEVEICSTNHTIVSGVKLEDLIL